MPLSMERNRDTKRRSPKTKEKTRRFVPKGKFFTTSNMSSKTTKGKRSVFHSTFLKRKRKRIMLIRKLRKANRKLSRKTKSIIDAIIRIAVSTIFCILN